MTPWLTVITVVRDDPQGLEATMASLSEQDRTGVDVLVVDSSADRAHAPRAADGLARVEWTEPRGIYPAMNTGLSSAVGEYVYYLNAGDTLHSSDVLANLAGVTLDARPAWLFGRVEVVGADGTRVVTPAWDYAREKAALFARGLFPPHQGTVARTALLRDVGGFDTAYRIAADYAAFLRLSCQADPLVIDQVLATFHEGGASTQHWQESFREFHRARREILRPTGLAAVQERASTAWHFSKVFAYREVALRARR